MFIHEIPLDFHSHKSWPCFHSKVPEATVVGSMKILTCQGGQQLTQWTRPLGPLGKLLKSTNLQEIHGLRAEPPPLLSFFGELVVTIRSQRIFSMNRCGSEWRSLTAPHVEPTPSAHRSQVGEVSPLPLNCHLIEKESLETLYAANRIKAYDTRFNRES